MKNQKLTWTGISMLTIVVACLSFSFKNSSALYCVYQRSGATCPLNTMAIYREIMNETNGDLYIMEAREDCKSSVDVSYCIQQVTYTAIRPVE